MAPTKQLTTGELVDGLKRKWVTITAIFTVTSAAFAAYNSKASSGDLAAVKDLLITQDKNTAVLQARLEDLARLREDIAQLRQRVDRVADRAFTPANTTTTTTADGSP